MSTPAQAEVRRLFLLAMEAPIGEREAALESACGQNAALRAEVESLLRSESRAGGFMGSPTASAGAGWPVESAGDAATVAALPREGPGTRIGPYRIQQLIGEGGFGSVFLAEQERPVARKVALKIIKLGMDTRQVIARFEAERQALALMEHPGIAKVLDAGATETGRPYFVMELCKGEPIVAYCDRNGLTVPERLDVFAQVCGAVQHAHTKGIIHRDLKPSNILVSTLDGAPAARVIDFGIAKATAGRLTDRTLFTEQRQLIGTPEYMSPEQAEGSLDIDTRTDVYSLGVLLYELLTGTTPFKLSSTAYAEIQRIVREVEPPKPSTRLSQSHDSIADIAARRRTEPRRLSGIVRGELDWIVMKALEKDRSRRYETANGLAMDIRRHLSGEPVMAAPPSRAYLLQKFVRRNRGEVAAAGAVALTLVLGLAGTAWQAHRASAERDTAIAAGVAETHARQRAETISGFVTAALQSGDALAGGGQDVTILNAMSNAIADIEGGRFRDDPQTEAGLRGVIATVLMNNGRLQEAERLASQSLDGIRASHRDAHADVAAALTRLAEVRRLLGRLREAEPLFAEALEMNLRLYPGDHPEVARSLNRLALMREGLGRMPEAEELQEQSFQMTRRLHADDHVDVARAMGYLAYLRRMLHPDRIDQTEALYVAALEMTQRLFPGDHPEVASAIHNLAIVRQNRGLPAEAEPLYLRALEMYQRLYRGDHPRVAALLNDAAFVQEALGRFAEAEQTYLRALKMRRRIMPGDHPGIALNMTNLGFLCRATHRPSEALAYFSDALDMYRRLFPGDHPDVARCLVSVLSTRQLLGDLPGAEALAYEALEMSRRLYFGDHAGTASAMIALAGVLHDRGEHAAAEGYARSAVEMRVRLVGPDHAFTAKSRLTLARALVGLSRRAEAETELLAAEPALAASPLVGIAEVHSECVAALVALYETWNEAEMGKGYDAKAAEWRAKLPPG